jgi:hypothetical protein
VAADQSALHRGGGRAFQSRTTCKYNHGRGCGTASPRLTRPTQVVWSPRLRVEGSRGSPNPSGAVQRPVYLLLHPSPTRPHLHPTRPGSKTGERARCTLLDLWVWAGPSVVFTSRELVSEPSADEYKMAQEPRCRRPHHPSIGPDLANPCWQSPVLTPAPTLLLQPRLTNPSLILAVPRSTVPSHNAASPVVSL